MCGKGRNAKVPDRPEDRTRPRRPGKGEDREPVRLPGPGQRRRGGEHVLHNRAVHRLPLRHPHPEDRNQLQGFHVRRQRRVYTTP